MQHEKTFTEQIVKQVRADVVKLHETIESLKSGKLHPLFVRSRMWISKQIPWDEADKYDQDQGLNAAIWNAEGRAVQGTNLANGLETLIAKVYGTALVEVEKPAKAEPILKGDVRQSEKMKLIATRVEGARVYWTSDTGRKGWTGSRKWRNMPPIQGE